MKKRKNTNISTLLVLDRAISDTERLKNKAREVKKEMVQLEKASTEAIREFVTSI